MLDLSQNVSLLREKIRAGRRDMLKPPPIMKVDEWADEYRYLTRESSSTGGKYKVATVEVARGPLRAITEPGVRKITIMSATQLMKTTVIENAIGYFSHLDPAPILLLQPKEDFAAVFSKEKLVPMIMNTPELLKAFGGEEAFKSRSSDNTIGFKKFSGGFLALTSAGSPTNLAMRAIRLLLADEVDKYPITKEGDSLAVAGERLETFPFNSLQIAVCSPTIQGESRIEAEYLDGDQRRAFCACPKCGYEQVPEWENVNFKDEHNKNRPEIASIVCQNPNGCSHAWTEPERRRIMTTKDAIKWKQTKKFSCCDETQDPTENRLWIEEPGDMQGRALCKKCGSLAVDNEHASFLANALYSPWSTLEKTVKKFLSCKHDKEKLRVFTNTRLARTFADDGGMKAFEPDENLLQSRAEPPWTRIPENVLVLTAGVDTQNDRLEVEVVGWGHGEESWSLEYLVIPGDPATDAPWQVLDRALRTPRIREDGAAMSIMATCVDSGGHHTEEVYAFCNDPKRKGLRVYAIHGAPDIGPVKSPVWPKAFNKVKDKRRRSFGQRWWYIGTHAAKNKLETYMKVSAASGPGAMHIPADREAEWFKQFCGQKKVARRVGGRVEMRWVDKYNGIRVEALDCRVYAYGALQSLRVNGHLKSHQLAAPGAALEDLEEDKAEEIIAQIPSAPSPEDLPKPKPKKRRPPPAQQRPGGMFGGGGFGGGFGGGGGMGGFGGMRSF